VIGGTVEKNIFLTGGVLLGVLFLLPAYEALAESRNSNFDPAGNSDGGKFHGISTPPVAGTLAKTGQTNCYDTEGNSIDCAGTGQDGEYQKGVSKAKPRFTNNGDGTVTDNLTSLIWLKNANCFGTKTWDQALSACNGLSGGQCGLSDGSTAGDWRLPNVRELYSLVHYGFYNPSVPNSEGNDQWREGDLFNEVSAFYWSSTTHASTTMSSLAVDINFGSISIISKSTMIYVWPVCGGQQ
jgi:hypothetical protein